jgi:ribosomal protein L11 methyltransferase
MAMFSASGLLRGLRSAEDRQAEVRRKPCTADYNHDVYNFMTASILPWLQFSLDVPGDRAEAVSSVMDDAGALSVTILDAADEPLLEPLPGETPLWNRARIVALFEPNTDPRPLQQRLRKLLAMPGLQLRVEQLDDRDWSTTWRDTFGAMCFGRRLWVCPVGEDPAQPDAVVVHLDPGLAFGTGTHATTALCLAWLDAHSPAGLSVIDYGCGSGILAIAASKLGADSVVAVDIDPQALQATRENALRNHINAQLTVVFPQKLETNPVDVLLANILANPLIEHSASLATLVKPRGHIVLTGILEEQAGVVMAAYRQWFDFDTPVQREDWVLLAGSRRES